jgi:spermidine synthase
MLTCLLTRMRPPRSSEEGYSRCATSVPPEVLFDDVSSHGNGRVRVIRHGPWLALRFDDSEQGLSFASEPGAPDYAGGAALPQVLGFEYLRVMAASAAAFASLNGCNLAAVPASRDAAHPRILCVGLGAGALPAFLAHHFAPLGARVCVAEIDPLIIRVVRDVLRVDFELADSAEALLQPAAAAPRRRKGAAAEAEPAPFVVAEADGCAVVAALAEEVAAGTQRGAALLLLDAYEARGRIPAHLKEPSFLAACGAALAPNGLVVANLFNGTPNSTPRKEMAAYARALATAVGPVYSVKVQAQQTNVILIAAKAGSPLAADGAASRSALAAAARQVARAGGWEYDAGAAVERMFAVRVRPGGVVESVPGRMIDWPKESSAADHTYAD